MRKIGFMQNLTDFFLAMSEIIDNHQGGSIAIQGRLNISPPNGNYWRTRFYRNIPYRWTVAKFGVTE
jgi:hypothetical protein